MRGTVARGGRRRRYVEAYGQWNANAPSNGITNLRGFDNRSGTLALANANASSAELWKYLQQARCRVTAKRRPTRRTGAHSRPSRSA